MWKDFKSRLSDYKQALGSKRSHWKRWEVATKKLITREERTWKRQKKYLIESTKNVKNDGMKHIELDGLMEI